MTKPIGTEDKKVENQPKTEDPKNDVCICVECGFPFSRIDTEFLCDPCIIEIYKKE